MFFSNFAKRIAQLRLEARALPPVARKRVHLRLRRAIAHLRVNDPEGARKFIRAARTAVSATPPHKRDSMSADFGCCFGEVSDKYHVTG
jgi:hypothetical protein